MVSHGWKIHQPEISNDAGSQGFSYDQIGSDFLQPAMALSVAGIPQHPMRAQVRAANRSAAPIL